MIEVVFKGNTNFREEGNRWTTVDLDTVFATDVEAIRITGDDVLRAWNQYISALPWPRWAAFHDIELRKPGYSQPTSITWFGDDAKFAVANWRVW